MTSNMYVSGEARSENFFVAWIPHHELALKTTRTPLDLGVTGAAQHPRQVRRRRAVLDMTRVA